MALGTEPEAETRSRREVLWPRTTSLSEEREVRCMPGGWLLARMVRT